MLNRILVVFCSSLVCVATAVVAETAQVNNSTPTAAPSNLVWSPSIWTGARSNITGIFSNSTKDVNTFGAFVKPGIQLKYNSDPVSVSTSYTFETSSAKGFGDGNQFKSVSNNTYYQHEPIALISLKANDSWKANAFGDLWINTENKRSQNTFYELTLQPDVEYQIAPTVSIAAGYQFFQKNYFDTSVSGESTGIAGIKAAVTATKPTAFKASSADVIGQSPVTSVNSGIITARVKLGEKSAFSTYFRAGRQTSTILGRTGMNYRINADLSTPITNKLSAQLRYRLHIEDNDSAKAWYYNRGRVILSYAFTGNWSADVQDTFQIEHTTANTSQAKFSNENYAGVTYKF